MKKIILDTNVLISGLIQKNYPHFILLACIDNKVSLCLSQEILKEYKEVLARPKFARFPDFKSNADFFINRIASIALFYEPSIKINIINDEADNRFLELAEASKADYLITGNTNDFTMNHYKTKEIISPKKYWETAI